MMLEPIGLFTVLIGIACLLSTIEASLVGLGIAAVLGAACALFVGGANVQPGHLFLGFVVIAALSRRREASTAIRALNPDEAGFWLACLAIYGVASAFFVPRLLAGTTDIVALGTSIYEDNGSTVPLTPVSSNLTQSVYLIANLVCFLAVVAIAATQKGFEAVLKGVLAYCAANLAFAAIDLATFYSGTQAVLEFMRNAQYVMHTEDQVAGMKRIAGSFPEASAFARSTLGVFGLTGTLFLCGRYTLLTGGLAVCAAISLVFSTSSTGLAGAPVMLLLLYATATLRAQRPGGRTAAVVVVAAPAAAVAVCIGVMLEPTLSQIIQDYFNLVLLDKSSSDSSIERSAWNAISFQNFLDTHGIGVGLGTARASSFAVALLATVGVPGALFYGAFLASALFMRQGIPGSFGTDVRLAARNGCIGLLLGDMLVSPVIDQGLFFYMLAALAAARPKGETDTARSMIPGFPGRRLPA